MIDLAPDPFVDLSVERHQLVPKRFNEVEDILQLSAFMEVGIEPEPSKSARQMETRLSVTPSRYITTDMYGGMTTTVTYPGG